MNLDPHTELAAATKRCLFLRDQHARSTFAPPAFAQRCLSNFYAAMDDLAEVFERQPIEVRMPLAGDPVSMARLELKVPGPPVWEGADRGRD